MHVVHFFELLIYNKNLKFMQLIFFKVNMDINYEPIQDII